MKLEIDVAELSTIRLALYSWSARGRDEAKVMKGFSEDPGLSQAAREKSARNAAVSLDFHAEAEALIAKIRGV